MKIAIDPGHGMGNITANVYDPGATMTSAGFFFEEASIALRYSHVLRAALLTLGTEPVFLSREDRDDQAPLIQRAPSAKLVGAQALVSIHCNSHTVATANGIEVLYRTAASKPLAQVVQAALVNATGLTNRGIKVRSELAVLKFDGPAILIELGFISNTTDRASLIHPGKRHMACEAIAKALLGPW